MLPGNAAGLAGPRDWDLSWTNHTTAHFLVSIRAGLRNSPVTSYPPGEVEVFEREAGVADPAP
jgi:hypothetical protein